MCFGPYISLVFAIKKNVDVFFFIFFWWGTTSQCTEKHQIVFKQNKKLTCPDSQIIVILAVFCYLTSYFLIKKIQKSKIVSSQFVTQWSLHESFDLLVKLNWSTSFCTCIANNMKFYLFCFQSYWNTDLYNSTKSNKIFKRPIK